MEPGTREVWWASTAWMRPWHADVLSDGERARRAGLWDPGHRARYTVAAARLRLVATPLTGRTRGRCGGRPDTPELRPAPRPAAPPGAGPHVSISRFGEHLLTAG